MLFFKEKKSEKTSDAFEFRLQDLEKRVKKVENEILGLSVENEVIRNKVLRKMQFKKKEFEEAEAEETGPATPKVLNSPFSPFM